MPSSMTAWLVPALLLSSAVAPGNASPFTGLVPGNGTADDLLGVDGYGNGAIARRAILAKRMPASASDDVMQRLVQQGRVFNSWLFEGDISRTGGFMGVTLGADPSKNDWQRKSAPGQADNHWTIEDTTHTLDPDNPLGLKEALEGQKVGSGGHAAFQKPRTIRTAAYPKGPMVRIKMTQDKDIRYHDRYYAATDAVYETMFNIVDGVIVVDEAMGPNTMLQRNGRPKPPHMPMLSDWSDAVWWLWSARLRIGGHTKQPTNWPFLLDGDRKYQAMRDALECQWANLPKPYVPISEPEEDATTAGPSGQASSSGQQ